MPGISDYLNRDTSRETEDPAALILDAAQQLHRAGAIYDVRKRSAEMAQMSETDPKAAADLEPGIQKLVALLKDITEFSQRMRRHGMQTVVRLADIEAKLRTKYEGRLTQLGA